MKTESNLLSLVAALLLLLAAAVFMTAATVGEKLTAVLGAVWRPLQKAVSLTVALTTLAMVLTVGGCSDIPSVKCPSCDIFQATDRGDIGRVVQLLDSGVDVNMRGEHNATPLHLAAFHGHTEVAKVLIAAGADLNVKEDGGLTPLSLATYKRHAEVIEILKAAGARK